MTRREAADYLRWSVDTIDRLSVKLEDHKNRVAGKLRYQHIESGKAIAPVRILRSDVHAILPPPVAT